MLLKFDKINQKLKKHLPEKGRKFSHGVCMNLMTIYILDSYPIRGRHINRQRAKRVCCGLFMNL